ncbi:exosome complex component CSL4 [Fistulifera solaris]|jgi:exosome complex component CSL4|uniref:Exosome complex component CSL4 n=1 Tax=Fistulifera solaris TaxID=1519565 RepID=A0A1Z5KAW2_FISSO|nr:exosome complex component CSL4 [Fistulifera solaris]|eukprot:GAX23295.1 exosome complex component CSL4 [Fistulifera solaris]
MNNNSRLRYEIDSFVVPGDRLGSFFKTTVPGPGTSARKGHLYASTAGRLSIQQQEEQSLITVTPPHDFASRRVITVGQIVLAKVDRVSWTQAHVSIFATETGGTLQYPAEAIVRREDIGSTVPVTHTTNTNTANNKTSWQVIEAVRPGDWIVARVLSLGDTQRYMLTLAEPQLGVWYALSAKGGTVMQPKSWNTMVCPKTGVEESRKCAKPRC